MGAAPPQMPSVVLSATHSSPSGGLIGGRATKLERSEHERATVASAAPRIGSSGPLEEIHGGRARIGLLAVLLAVIAMVPTLRSADWSLTALPRVDSKTALGAAAHALDPGFHMVHPGAYDGQFYWGIAIDPLAIGELHRDFDKPSYRYGHPLYGWLGWLLSADRARAVPAALAAIGLAVAVSPRRRSQRRSGCASGAAGWEGLFVALNPGLISSAAHDLAEPLAAALLLGALAAHVRDAWRSRWICLALLPLAKEPLLLVVLAVVVWELVGHRARRAAISRQRCGPALGVVGVHADPPRSLVHLRRHGARRGRCRAGAAPFSAPGIDSTRLGACAAMRRWALVALLALLLARPSRALAGCAARSTTPTSGSLPSRSASRRTRRSSSAPRSETRRSSSCSPRSSSRPASVTRRERRHPPLEGWRRPAWEPELGIGLERGCSAPRRARSWGSLRVPAAVSVGLPVAIPRRSRTRPSAPEHARSPTGDLTGNASTVPVRMSAGMSSAGMPVLGGSHARVSPYSCSSASVAGMEGGRMCWSAQG